MTDWQVTAVTLKCPGIADEATVIVKSDWTVTCTGMTKYTKDRAASLDLVKRSMQYRRSLECKGLNCPTITAYIEKLKLEEAIPTAPAGESK
ncbi:MAG: hypothetical protein PHE50_01595 [Dehalococcoidales bacterium]|nr:hypothetical protein [Dehalococcoidales bacterium]